MTNHISDAVFQLGEKNIERIKSATKIQDIDTRRATERWSGELICQGFEKHLGIPFLITGGRIYPQIERETGDLDLLFVRKPDVFEIHRAFEQMRPDLLAHGLVLEKYPRSPEDLYIRGETGQRYNPVFKAGPTRINLQIDIVGGSHLFPKGKQERRTGSVFFNGQKPLTAIYQSVESNAADKLDAILTRSDSTRWKDWSDLAMLWNMRVDPAVVALELVHQLRRRFPTPGEVMAKLPADPAQFGTEYAEGKAAAWKLWEARHRRTNTDFIGILCDSRKFYHSVRTAVIAHLKATTEPTVRRPKYKDTLPPILTAEMRNRPLAARKKRDGDERVVNLDDYREDHIPAYRPKF